MSTDRRAIEDLASRLTRDTISARVRIATVTDDDGSKVQTDITDTAWLPRDADASISIGDRVWVLQQGPMMLVAGRLSGPYARPSLVRKGSQQDVTSSTTLVDATNMGIDLDVGTWRIELFAHAANNVATDDGDIRLAWTFSGTAASSTRSCLGPGAATTAAAGDSAAAGSGVSRASAATLTGSTIYGISDNVVVAIHEDVTLEVSAPGTLQLQFAQGTSNGTPTSLSATTRMYVTPVWVP